MTAWPSKLAWGLMTRRRRVPFPRRGTRDIPPETQSLRYGGHACFVPPAAATEMVNVRSPEGMAMTSSTFTQDVLSVPGANNDRSGTLGDAADKTCLVSIIDNARLEGEETFTVTLFAPPG